MTTGFPGPRIPHLKILQELILLESFPRASYGLCLSPDFKEQSSVHQRKFVNEKFEVNSAKFQPFSGYKRPQLRFQMNRQTGL